jgi:hypothetical protein
MTKAHTKHYKKTKDCVTSNQLKPELNLGAPEG